VRQGSAVALAGHDHRPGPRHVGGGHVGVDGDLVGVDLEEEDPAGLLVRGEDIEAQAAGLVAEHVAAMLQGALQKGVPAGRVDVEFDDKCDRGHPDLPSVVFRRISPGLRPG